MSVELRDLRWAIVTSQHRSLRQAALALNVRQSTLSRRLREIESKLGAELFERTNRGTRPTFAGREFLSAARNVLADLECAIGKLRMGVRGENGRLRIGVHASLSTGNLYVTLVEHHRQFPDVQVHTVDGDQDQLLDALSNDAVDLAVLAASSAVWHERSLSLWSERVIVAMSKQHRLAEKETVHWADLAGEPILMPQHGPGRELERLLIANLPHGVRQHVLHQASGLDRLLSLVSAGYGVLLMLEGGVGVHFDSVTFREVHNGCGATRLNFTAYWRDANANPTLSPFLAMLRQRYPDISGEAGTS
ncbi:LysR family transcriptional regulator [Methylocapsa polymorpha]|uniref:LysR family transcriptional regulator n=1 Tax=Methylocapsa polymorpha TaxID=3080828 RepID=A0ABZ0HQ09_9HYPH|nr:LysR family transcriptional regulator [Methylocapsa sp. RX1]